jgi:hypothetical protein
LAHLSQSQCTNQADLPTSQTIEFDCDETKHLEPPTIMRPTRPISIAPAFRKRKPCVKTCTR